MPAPSPQAFAGGTLIRAELTLAGRLDARFFALLQALHDSGSLHQAARAAGYSYKGAWLVLDTANGLASTPLVEAARGGSRGGGSRLTEAGQDLLTFWRQLATDHAQWMHRFADRHEQNLSQHPRLNTLLKRMSMKTSARNQFVGTVSTLVVGPVSTEVDLALPGGQTLTALLGSRAAKELKLKKGREVMALVKASEVVLVTHDAGFRLSAGNQLAGTVSRVSKGAVSSLVGVTLPGGQVITASVTNDAVDALDLKVGQAATAVFNASAVMLAA
jgi:molybdate transport system regulatory protein